MSNVSYNIRVLRTDRKPVKALEAAAVLAFFVDYKHAPDGYRVEVVDWAWRSRGGRVRRGRPATAREAREVMEEAFWYTLRGQLRQLRVGTVKP